MVGVEHVENSLNVLLVEDCLMINGCLNELKVINLSVAIQVYTLHDVDVNVIIFLTFGPRIVLFRVVLQDFK